MGEWQPIETAPKDGSLILVYTPPQKNYYQTIFMAVWRDVYNAFAIFYSYDRVTHEESIVRNPTHWIPLPEPPI